MIRSRRIPPAELTAWLAENVHRSQDGRYTLRVLTEQLTARASVWDHLVGYVHEAHEDAKLKLRKAIKPTLSPFVPASLDPAAGYPERLHLATLMGYFGEILAGLVAEHKAAHGLNWQVPVFLFRFHETAFQRLEQIANLEKQGLAAGPADDQAMKVVGRTADDALAFLVGPKGELAAILVCEAKCLQAHNTKIASDAHDKLAQRSDRPDSLSQVLQILRDYDTPGADEWYQRLAKFHFDPSQKAPRYDLLLYAIGNKPVAGGRTTWLSETVPDKNYTAARNLEAVELRLENPQDLVDRIYRPKPSI